MATLRLRFPGGLYHATPTGHHVNEGLVEWPPSPWRLVRALVACGYTTLHWREVPVAGRKLVDALARGLPEYRLPQAALGHSRHYMPTVLEKGRAKPTLVLDSFADVGTGTAWVRWPARLDAEAAALFAELAGNLGYLGRSESWIEAELASDDLPLPSSGRAFPHVEGQRPGMGYEQLALTAPEIPESYDAWRSNEVTAVLAALPPLSKKPTKAQLEQRALAEMPYPVDLVACLQLDTAWWRECRWSQAPGTRRVLYWREDDALAVGPPAAPRRPAPPRVEAVLLALTTPSGSTSALPTVARTLPQAELLHRALVSRLGAEALGCPELSGRGSHGKPLLGHEHAHILPVDLDRDGHLDHVVMFARMGFGEVAQRALRSLRRTWTKGGVGELRLALVGRGALDDLRRLPGGLGDSIDRMLGPSRAWISETPFVPPRHLKKHGRSTVEGQILAELASRNFPEARVEVVAWTPETLPLRHFARRRRPPARQPPLDAGFVIRLTFERPETGPICLGYASHFGAGRFAVATVSATPNH